MRWIALPVGIVLVVWTLLDVFRTLVMPLAVRRWPPPGPDPVPADLATLETQRPAPPRPSRGSGTGPGRGGSLLLLCGAGWLGLPRRSLALGADPVEPRVRGRDRAGGRVRSVTPCTSAGRPCSRSDPVTGVTGWTRAIVVTEAATGLGLFAGVIDCTPFVVSGLQPPRGRRAVARRAGLISFLGPRAAPPHGQRRRRLVAARAARGLGAMGGRRPRVPHVLPPPHSVPLAPRQHLVV